LSFDLSAKRGMTGFEREDPAQIARLNSFDFKPLLIIGQLLAVGGIRDISFIGLRDYV
jgi:hypothetical protein